MKKILLATLASSALVLTACSTSEEIASTEAGRIREDDLYEAMKSEQLQSGMTVGETVLQRLLIEDIFNHLYGDKVSDADVDAEFEVAAETYGGTEEYTEILEAQGMDVEFMKDNIRLTLLIREAVKANVEITDADLEEMYEDMKPAATVQHILVGKDDEELAKEIIAELEDGADFAELVAEHTTDPGSMATEGKYSFSEGEMVPEFEEASFALAEGETTTEPVETDHGFHIIRRLELDYDALEDQRDELETILLESYIQDPEFMAGLISEMAVEANVQIADDELKGAMAAYMTPPEAEIEDPDNDDLDEILEETEETEETEEDSEE